MSTPNQENRDIFDLPDEEVLAMTSAPEPAAPVTPEPTEPVEPAAAPSGSELPPVGEVDASAPPTPSISGDGGEAEGEGDSAEDLAPAQPSAEGREAGAPKPEGDGGIPDDPNKTAAAVADEPAEPKEPTAEDHKAFYERIFSKPIRANNKDIQLRSPEEVERLIQMGLNYTKKMQAWQPRMRVVTMLENNGLLDEAKLSHLIDLSKGDQLAIQKLLADSGFDPMTIDADKAASYRPGDHQVSDTQVQFSAVLDELESSETGAELITEVAKQWDEASKQAAYRDPDILRAINEHKANGLYAKIVSEMDHLRTLGHLEGVPFLQAYKGVGDMLNDQGRLRADTQKQMTPVATRVAAPPSKVSNNDKAAAASPTRTTTTAPAPAKNFLDISDEDFIKQMQGRV